MSMMANNDAARMRVAKFLDGRSALVRRAAREDEVLLDAGEGGRIGVRRKLLATMLGDGTLEISGNALRLAGGNERTRSPEISGQMDQALRREKATLVTGEGRADVLINTAESPLGSLWRHKARDGQRFLTACEFNAGERLRLDYTRGQIMPRLGINWGAAGASGLKRRDGNGLGDMTDSALAARDRVEGAIEAVGPELAGVLIDVCCFLKGLERVEAERGWPIRSGKVVLKSALAALARHYQPPQRTTGKKVILHWGSDDYRPQVGRSD